MIDVGWIWFFTKTLALCGRWLCGVRSCQCMELRRGCWTDLEQVSSNDYNAGGSITNFRVLQIRQFNNNLLFRRGAMKKKTEWLVFVRFNTKKKKTFAAGCSTSSCFRMVAPSFVIVTSPMSSTNILSNPTGPRDVLTTFATATTAVTSQQKKEFQSDKNTNNTKKITILSPDVLSWYSFSTNNEAHVFGGCSWDLGCFRCVKIRRFFFFCTVSFL